MKIMTLNTHSLAEKHYEEKLQQFVHGMLEEMPDVVALQEVNQHADAEAADAALLKDWLLCKSVTEPVKFTAGDMDADSILNAKDLTLLLRCAAA